MDDRPTRTRKWNDARTVHPDERGPARFQPASVRPGSRPDEARAVLFHRPGFNNEAVSEGRARFPAGAAFSWAAGAARRSADGALERGRDDGTVQDAGVGTAGRVKDRTAGLLSAGAAKEAKRRMTRQLRKRQAQVIAQKGGALAESAGTGGRLARLARRVARAFGVKGKAALFVIAVLVVPAVLLTAEMSSAMSAVSGLGAMESVTFQASDADIDRAEAYYCGLENDLRQQVKRVPQTRPGYGDYLYEADEIGHEPLCLIAYLTAVYGDFTFQSIRPALDALFQQQYHLTLTVQQPEENSGTDGSSSVKPAGKPSLRVRLDAKDFTQMVTPLLARRGRTPVYQALLQTRGNRQYFDSPLPFGWAVYTVLAPDNTAGLDVQAGVIVQSGISGTVQSAAGGSVTVAGSDGLKMTASGLSQLRVETGRAVGAGTPLGVAGGGLTLHFSRSGENLNPLIFADFGGPAENGAVPVGGQPLCGQPLCGSVAGYRSAVSQLAGPYGMAPYTDLILAVMQQESGGRGGDPMQAAEGPFNTRYPKCPDGITDPLYSISCGIRELRQCLQLANCTSPADTQAVELALQGYNFGRRYISWAQGRGGYSLPGAQAFSAAEAARLGWSGYGDPFYVPHVLRFYKTS